MRVLVTGANGQLGYDVLKQLDVVGSEYLAIDRNDVDITNEQEVKKVIVDFKPDVVIHCAAYTAVDMAEDEKEICYSVNVLGTKYIAKACKEIKAKMVYISTDYVFDGEGKEPFKVTDTPNPINYYGKTKYEGELEVKNNIEKYYIVRISWVFGTNGNNFVKTMLRLGHQRDEVSVVSDQIGSPTYTYDLAKFLVELIQTDEYGIHHITNDEYCSWFEFACEIFLQAGLDIRVNPIESNRFPTKAKRPLNSRMVNNRNYNVAMPTWKDALRRFVNEL